jgi:hypothetical protein
MFSKSFELFNFNNFEKEKKEKSLEEDFLGVMDSDRYKELAYIYLNQKNIDKISDLSEKFKSSIDIKDRARESFKEDSDYLGKNFIPYQKATELIEECQLKQEKNNSPFISSLLKKIQENFSDDYEIKFLSSVGENHLHKVFGVDGIIKVYDRESGQEVASSTIDLNDSEERLETDKADVLFDIDSEVEEKLRKGFKGDKNDKEYSDLKLEEYSRLVTMSLEDKTSEEISVSA